jgi:hypothetical protein
VWLEEADLLSEDRCSSSDSSSERGTAELPDYEPPRLTVLGSIAEVTQAAGVGVTDAAVFSAAISDRRLKRELEPVDALRVLEAVSGLPISA